MGPFDALLRRFGAYLHHQAHDVENRRVIIGLIERRPGARLLDVGCGDGAFTATAALKAEAGEIWGVDIVEDLAGAARSMGVQVRVADLNQGLPFDDGYFDVVLANQIIEHLHDTDSFLAEIRRVLKAGGYAIVSTPNLASLHNIFFLMLGKQPPAACYSDEIGTETLGPEGHPGYPSHRRIFTGDALRKVLAHHGFLVERVVGVGYYPMPLPMARVFCRVDGRHAAYITIKPRKGAY